MFRTEYNFYHLQILTEERLQNHWKSLIHYVVNHAKILRLDINRGEQNRKTILLVIFLYLI